MLVKSYKKLWLMKVELKKLEILKSPMKNLIVLFYVLGCDSNCSDDEGKDVYTAEFVWPSSDKPCAYGSLILIRKDRCNTQNLNLFKFKTLLFK